MDAKSTFVQPSSGDRVVAGLLAFANSAKQSEGKSKSEMPVAAVAGAISGYKSLASSLKHKPAPAIPAANAEKEQQKSPPGVKGEDRIKPSFLRAGFAHLGEYVAEEEPVVLPNGERDYHAGDIVKEQALKHEAEVTAAAATVAAKFIPGAGRMIGGYVKKELVHRGIEALGEIMPKNPGGLTLATPNGATISGAVELAPAAVGIAEGAKIATAAATLAGAMLPRDDVPLSLEYRGDGKGSTHKAGPVEKSTQKERKIDTPETQNAHWDKLIESGEWERRRGYSNPTLRNKKSGQLIQKSKEKYEIEVFDRHKNHIGVIKPNDGVLRKELVQFPRLSCTGS